MPGVPHVDHNSCGERAAPHPDRVIAELATRQAGMVGRWQLAARGLTRREIEHRIATGHLVPVHRGVYAAGHWAKTARGRIWAGALALGREAVVSHRTAAAELGLMNERGSLVHVTVSRRARARRGIAVHEAQLEPHDRTRVNGLPVTSVARTLLDLAAGHPVRDELRALEQAEKLDLLNAIEIDEICERSGGHRGVGRLRQALIAYDPRHHDVRSLLERDALPLIDAAGLPRPQINARLEPYEFDLYWPDQGVVVELDSWEHHRTRRAFEEDRARDRWLAVRGVQCLRVTWRQLRAGALEDLAQVLAARRRVRAA